MAWWNPLPAVEQIGKFLGQGVGQGYDIVNSAFQIGGGGAPPSAAQQAWNQLQKQGLTGAQIAAPSQQLIQQYAQALGALPAGTMTKDLQALAKTAPALATDIQNYLVGGGAAGGGAQQPQTAYQYGFDPMSMRTIFNQAFVPFIQQNQQAMTAGLGQYNQEMQQALAGANPAIQQAYAQTEPGLQAGYQAQVNAAPVLGVEGSTIDQFISNLADATQSAKSAQSVASTEPYLSYLYQAAYGGGAAGGAGATGPLGVPTSTPGATTSPFNVNPFQPGIRQAGTPATAQPATTTRPGG